jgi:hypothetical protein
MDAPESRETTVRDRRICKNREYARTENISSARTKRIFTSASLLVGSTDLGGGRRLGCGLGEGSDSHGGPVDTIHLISH